MPKSSFERYCDGMGVRITHAPERPSLTKDEKGWEHYAYTVTLEFQGRTMATPFKCGSGHASKNVYPGARPIPIPPSAADVLYSLVSDSDALDRSFDDWAGDLGYDSDSRKALEIYLACQRLGREVKALLGPHFEEFATASREH